MAKYCADCAYRAPGIKKNGKFPCTNSRSGYSEVPATQPASYCSVFCDAMGSTYSTREKEEAYRASKKHGWFITTAISDILGLGMDNEYMDAFGYIREVYVPEVGYQRDFFETYDIEGASFADEMYADENREMYAEYLKETYLDSFVSLVKENKNDEAIDLYIAMYNGIKTKYTFENSKKLSVTKVS